MVMSWSIRTDQHYAWISYSTHPAIDFVTLESVRPSYAGMLNIAISLQKAFLCTGWDALCPAITSLRDQVEVSRLEIMDAINSGMGQPWHHEEASGLSGIEKGLAELDTLLQQPVRAPLQQSGSNDTQLVSSTRIPPRLWLLGNHGVCALLDLLATRQLAAATEA